MMLILNAQDTVSTRDSRTQYPHFLANSYFSVNMGYINYPFTNVHMESGYSAGKVHIPNFGVRMIIGYSFLPGLSAQISYMRPILWVEYKDINVNNSTRSVYMNVGGLTLKYRHALSKKLSLFGEAGLGIVTRSGFRIDDEPVVTDATYSTVQTGVGVDLHLNEKWDLGFTGVYTPGRSSVKQPPVSFISVGFRYNMRPLSQEKVIENASTGLIFPKNLLQVGYTTNAAGYGVNNALSGDGVPIFWGGDIEIEKGVSLHYLRNVFHTKKVFALDVGGGLSWWRSSKNKDAFFTLSLMPVLRFTAVRTKPADFYLFYSVAGPTYISKVKIDDQVSGKHFTFMDYMGIGMFAGKQRKLNAEININHYSNGNIYAQNPGLKIPLTFNLGYTW